MGKIYARFLGITEDQAKETNGKAYIKDETTGKCYVIPYGCWTVGRKDDIDLDIPIETDDLYMSREQAVIMLRKNIIGENSLFIRDTVKRANSARVDGYKIDNDFDFQLYNGTTLMMGYTNFTVHLNPINNQKMPRQ